MVYSYIILKVYIVLIQNQRKSFIDSSIQHNSMQQPRPTLGTTSGKKELKKDDIIVNPDEDNDYDDMFTPEQLKELEFENFLNRELDATLEFKEQLEEYVYNNFLPFLKYFDMRILRNMFL